MLKSITPSLAAVALAALIATLVAGLPPHVPAAMAAPALADTLAPHVKGDRLHALAKGSACSTRGWPHYEPSCQFDLRRSADAELGKVRVIAIF
jgi:hypothetical protein